MKASFLRVELWLRRVLLRRKGGAGAGAPPGPAPAPTPGRGRALWGLLHAARLRKNLPLLLLLAAGALTAPGGPRPGLLAAATAFTLVASAFMTHVNNLTDAELDRERKPHLFAWMSADPPLTRAVVAAEFAAVAAGLAAFALARPLLAAGLAAFTALTTLYSYNFLAPARAVAWRLKAFWWGHFAVCLGAYLALWLAGHFCGAGSTWGAFAGWLPLFFFVSLSEYSLFLTESAADAAQERRLGLKTFAALLGRRRSSVLAVGVWLAAAAGAAAYAAFAPSPAARRLALVAFAPALLLRGAANAVLALGHDDGRDEALRSQLPDLVFWGGRLITVYSLAVGSL
ncbi:MAG TPA: UbiA family prenyltransferase [Polyangiaceae bacterium]|nr:UbiA family prenyltransferase [Polyangiaceae bacterium]